MEYFEILQKLRKNKGINQTELSKVLNTSQSNESKYERGVIEPNIEQIRKICIFFDITADYLLGLSTNPKKGRFDEQE